MDNEKFRGRIQPQIMAQELAKVRNNGWGSLEGQMFLTASSILHWLDKAS